MCVALLGPCNKTIPQKEETFNLANNASRKLDTPATRYRLVLIIDLQKKFSAVTKYYLYSPAHGLLPMISTVLVKVVIMPEGSKFGPGSAKTVVLILCLPVYRI